MAQTAFLTFASFGERVPILSACWCQWAAVNMVCNFANVNLNVLRYLLVIFNTCSHNDDCVPYNTTKTQVHCWGFFVPSSTRHTSTRCTRYFKVRERLLALQQRSSHPVAL